MVLLDFRNLEVKPILPTLKDKETMTIYLYIAILKNMFKR